MAQFEQWSGFNGRLWKEEVNIRDFIQNNYTPYEGDESFLVGPTEATDKLWGELQIWPVTAVFSHSISMVLPGET